MNDDAGNEGVPLGFGMALAQNTSALERFSTLSDRQKKMIIEGARAVSSRKEMREYVNGIAGTL